MAYEDGILRDANKNNQSELAWVEKRYYSMKELYNNRGLSGNPVQEFLLKGSYAWKDLASARSQTLFFDENDDHLFPKAGSRDGYKRDDYLLLKDNDIPFMDSSAAKIRCAVGWKIELVLSTDRNDYWTENTSGLTTWTARPALLNRQDYVRVTLEGGDWVSVDLDSEFSKIANLTIMQGGQEMSINSPDNVDDEVRIIAARVWHYEVKQDEVQGPLLPGGTGDLDQDGVPDGEDPDPNDPDIMKEGDVDDDPVNQDDVVIVPPSPTDPPTCGEGEFYNEATGMCELIIVEEDEEPSVFKALTIAVVIGIIGYLAFVVVRQVNLPGGEE